MLYIFIKAVNIQDCVQPTKTESGYYAMATAVNCLTKHTPGLQAL